MLLLRHLSCGMLMNEERRGKAVFWEWVGTAAMLRCPSSLFRAQKCV